MLNVFLNVILPTFLVAAAGAGLQRWRGLPLAPLNQLMLYLLVPALIIDSLMRAELDAALSARVVGAAVLATLGMIVVGTLMGRVLRQPRTLESAFLLVTAFPNAGNLALPIALLAFGQQGLAVAVILFATHSIMGWTIGFFIAARSSHTGLGPLTQTLRSPVLLAIIVALIVRASGVTLPTALAHPIGMLGAAAIPVMLVILGFQFSRGIELERWPSLTAALLLRLVGGAAVAYPITLLLGLDGVTQQTVIVVSAMPAAVFTTIVATEYRAEPRFVTSAVIAGTLLSLLTLTALISLLETWLG